MMIMMMMEKIIIIMITDPDLLHRISSNGLNNQNSVPSKGSNSSLYHSVLFLRPAKENLENLSRPSDNSVCQLPTQ
jgi:hypothetical protein